MIGAGGIHTNTALFILKTSQDLCSVATLSLLILRSVGALERRIQSSTFLPQRKYISVIRMYRELNSNLDIGWVFVGV